MINKKYNFVVSLIVFLLILVYGIYLDKIGCDTNPQWCADTLDISQGIFFTSILYTLISALLLLLPNHYFTTWWKFARIGLPLALAAVVYVNLTFTSGYMSWGTGFDLLIIGAIYGLFILGSLISVAYVWMRTGKDIAGYR